MALYVGFWRSTSILTCKLQGWRFRFAVNCRGSCAKTGLGAELLSGKVDTPRAVLSNMNDVLATAPAQQARPRQHRLDKVGQKQARQSRPDVQKPPRVYMTRPKGGKTHARQSRPEASQSRQDASNKHAKIVILSCVFDDFVKFADLGFV